MHTDTNKQSRLEHLIRRLVAEQIEFHLKDTRLEMVTIKDVQVTRDFQQAKIFWTRLGESEQKTNEARKALKSSTGRIRKALASQLSLRLTPSIEFIHDELENQVSSIEALIETAKKRDEELRILSANAKPVNPENEVEASPAE